MTPPRTRPIVNEALNTLIRQARWTRAAVAANVNAVAAEMGVKLSYDHSTVGHWLTGSVPLPAGICAATEAFRRRLGRPDLTSADLGWPLVAIAAPGHDLWQGDPVDRLAALGEDDMLHRRTVLTAGALALAELTAVPPPPDHPPAPRRGGSADVERVRASTRVFADLDDLYGGGHARAAVAAYLVSEVVPLLRGTRGRAQPQMFVAAGELTYLAAYMAADDGANGLAQRYYASTVRLADQAGDRVLRATALRSMAAQAAELGHVRQSRDLADAAAAALGAGGSARTRAWVRAMQGEAQGGMGDRWASLSLLRQAESLLERADSVPQSEWTGNFRRESLEHATALALGKLGDDAGAARHFSASMASRRSVERRTRALIGARAAQAWLRAGEVDHAAAVALDLGSVQDIRSARVQQEVRRLRAAWQPYRRNAQVADADRLLSAVPGR
ncbi:hypothetical protein [Bailinhaonella thermotolerans]|uniref:hypothetical protein n=1 Tax=Bailinhaonella thermotolerans TaxID=1070861 RepID=UPI001F5B33BD|nr:hypothetical protein [Bailinhaonella thermotolerans]